MARTDLKHLKRSALAVFFGYVLMAILVVAASVVASRLGLHPTTYLQVNVAYSYLFAAFGGYATAAMARRQGVMHGSVLAVVIIAMGLLTGTEAGRGQPRWYPAVVTFGGAAFAVLGAWLCSVQRRRRRIAAGG